ncbi:Gfo/Idh/MocA family protein [Vibrio ziniensis]|uniref:Gfo/Idh/MocA family oxidoreductase n=1 Tax=Vibrio ziniensis TaxID=2711221 RepID=A0A6G7CPE7_9VIBR|nr:Gfo/Idh/MocA family oxidoreductase [Vibrio ziniensis]QIH44021.1 Gfo/Idh/MocA family oxidoreductase [Vibrio ziniensis]
MNKSSINAVIIGTGMIAHVHFRSLKTAGVNVLGLVDANPEQAKKVAKAWGVEVFEELEQALKHDAVDVVHICTPNIFHYEMAKQALLAGKHVICEKPLATNLSDAIELQQLAAEKNVVTGVPFVYRYHPMVREARARIASGELGSLHLIHGSYLQDWLLEQSDNNWRVDPTKGGASRAFADIGSHWCDLMEWVTGERFTQLTSHFHTAQKERSTAATETFSDRNNQAIDNSQKASVTTEDIANLLLVTENNTPATLTISQVSAGRKNRLWFEIDGSNSSLEFDQEKPEQLWVNTREAKSLIVRDPTQGSDEQKRLSLTPAGHAQGYSHCFDAFIIDFYDTILGATPEGLPTFDDGARAAKIIDAALNSSKQKQWVSID